MNFAIPSLTGNPINYIGFLLISAIQMGATIDYAIILTNRYRYMKSMFPDKSNAMAQSVNAVFPTIITSGFILTLTGFVLAFTTTEPIISCLECCLESAHHFQYFSFICPSLAFISV